jgi:hypothetical protein
MVAGLWAADRAALLAFDERCGQGDVTGAVLALRRWIERVGT